MEQVQTGSRSAVASIDNSRQATEQAQGRAAEAEQALQAITAGINEIADLTAQMVAAARALRTSESMRTCGTGHHTM